jgi:hypothetical protein
MEGLSGRIRDVLSHLRFSNGSAEWASGETPRRSPQKGSRVCPGTRQGFRECKGQMVARDGSTRLLIVPGNEFEAEPATWSDIEVHLMETTS